MLFLGPIPLLFRYARKAPAAGAGSLMDATPTSTSCGGESGKMRVSMCGSLGHIAMRIVLSWLLIARMGLSAVALATGIGWTAVNVFWLVKYLRSQRETESAKM